MPNTIWIIFKIKHDGNHTAIDSVFSSREGAEDLVFTLENLYNKYFVQEYIINE